MTRMFPATRALPRRAALAALLASFAFAAVPAWSQMSLDQAKAAGLVGERPDGLVGAVDGAGGTDIQALVDGVNTQRLEHYAAIAAGNNSTVEAVQAVAGAELIERTPPGQYVMDAAGTWFMK
jgi:uncharacterized protein YdbL (DUF1318 family)